MPRALREHIDTLVSRGVEERIFPGAVWAIGDSTGTEAAGATGLLDPSTPAAPMRLDTLFDLASLTKIIAVWASVGVLWEEGRLTLDAPLARYFPELDGYPLATVTPHHLLSHTAGVPLRANLRPLYGTNRRAVIRSIMRENLHRPPGQAVEYTDRAALILAFLVERISGMSLERFSRTRIWNELAMASTRYGPVRRGLVARCAPTEWDDETGRYLRGTPHDFSARLLRVCGSAGVFSTVGDLGAFLHYLLAPERAATRGRVGFGPTWVRESLQVHTGQLQPSRGLFWHPSSDGDTFGEVWVHYGFTGTAMWVSPSCDRWAVLLTNKLYYTRDGNAISQVRRAFARAAFDMAMTSRVA